MKRGADGNVSGRLTRDRQDAGIQLCIIDRLGNFQLHGIRGGFHLEIEVFKFRGTAARDRDTQRFGGVCDGKNGISLLNGRAGDR